MYLLKMSYSIDFNREETIDICYGSDKNLLDNFIEQVEQYTQYKKKNLVLPEWLINSTEIKEILKDLGPLQAKLYSMKQLNLDSLKDDILEHEIIVGQLRIKLDTLNKEQRKYIEQKQKEITTKEFPQYIQNFYSEQIKQKNSYLPVFKVVEISSFEDSCNIAEFQKSP